METPTRTTHQIETVTPEIAERWLGTMRHNRKLNNLVIARLVDQMRTGRWVYDGSPIRFNLRGELVDGQHRLQALILAEFTAEFLVVRGVLPEAMATMDTGKTRTFADVLALEDASLVQAPALAAACQIIYRYESGARAEGLVSGRGRVQIANGALLEWFRENRERLEPLNRRAGSIRKRTRGLTGSALALCLWVLEDIDATDSDFFFARLQDGVGLTEDSPIRALRAYLDRVSEAGPGRSMLPTSFSTALVFKAWNAYRDGTPMKILAFRRGGANPEAYPTPR